ncbi:MAG: hypothetical protein QNL54_08535, partial [Rhodobacterales bacterium]
MKKILLTTTALTMVAGASFADVKVSGSARFSVTMAPSIAASAAVAAKAGTAYTAAQITALGAQTVAVTVTAGTAAAQQVEIRTRVGVINAATGVGSLAVANANL